MTKRQHSDQLSEEVHAHSTSTKQAKKFKIDSGYSSSKASTPPAISSNSNGTSTNTSATNATDLNDLSKEQRKALKRARKREIAERDVENNTSEEDETSKAERKALKRAKKAARKAAKLNGVANSDVTTNASVTIPEAPSLTYQEHKGLTALPQSEIDTFVSNNHLSVDDPLHQSRRPIISFDNLDLGNDALLKPFAKFTKPTPVQAACWPYLLSGRDVIGVAETGSGKTLAFALPCVKYIARLAPKERRHIKACIISPTRELAMQIYEQTLLLSEPAGLKTSIVYGGVSKDVQRETLKGTHILVATPGRLNDFIQEGSIDLSSVGYMVLDEADRMLDKGFEQEVRKIISMTPTQNRQTVMFTATWPPSVRDLAQTFMQTPVKITVGDDFASGELRANGRIAQEVEVIEDKEKQARLIQLLKQYQSGKNKHDRILVFCLYKKEATRIESFIRQRGFNVAGIHGDLNQQKRTESLEAFKLGRVPLLVATDVAARGLDIPDVTVVINYTFPLTVEDYVHRIGRTGRAGSDGKAVTLFTNNEKALSGALINVLKAAKQPVPPELLAFGTTVKKKGHEAYGAFYRDTSDMKKATRITFD